MSYFCNFFVPTPQGLLEVRSAPVQPAADIERSSQPLGYLFVGRLWNQRLYYGAFPDYGKHA